MNIKEIEEIIRLKKNVIKVEELKRIEPNKLNELKEIKNFSKNKPYEWLKNVLILIVFGLAIYLGSPSSDARYEGKVKGVHR